MEIPAAPLMAGNQGNTAIWWLNYKYTGVLLSLGRLSQPPIAVVRYVVLEIGIGISDKDWMSHTALEQVQFKNSMK